MNDLTLRKIAEAVKNDPVPVVPQSEIDAVCRAAALCRSKRQGLFDVGLWKVVFSCCSSESAFFWILSAFLLASCAMTAHLSGAYGFDPIAIMSALSPVPVIAFAIRETHYRDPDLVQIEKTCKYAPEKIYFARLWLCMLLNAVLVLLSGAVFSGYEHIARLYLCAFIAMFFVGAAALILMSLSDSTLPLSVCLSAWVLGAVFMLSEEEFIGMITNINATYLAIILLIGIGAFTAVTVGTSRKMYA